MRREQQRINQAIAVAATLSGLPSTLYVLRTGRSFRSAVRYVHAATCAVGTVLPPGRPGFRRGALVHLGISVAFGKAFARTLPKRRSVIWGAAAGLAMGVVNVGVIGRWFPAIRELPLIPQLADNVAFGVLFAAVADRGHG